MAIALMMVICIFVALVALFFYISVKHNVEKKKEEDAVNESISNYEKLREAHWQKYGRKVDAWGNGSRRDCR